VPWPVVRDDVLACVYVSDEEDRDEERERTLGSWDYLLLRCGLAYVSPPSLRG
jgi:hypothetical protein